MTHGPRIAAVVLALALLAAAPPPQQQIARPAGPQSTDTTLYHTLREVINRGADLYNAGDAAACYRIFEGSLISIRPLLEHRPELQKNINRGLASAERDPLTWRRAFTLRSVLDKLRAELNPNKSKDADRLGVPRIDDGKKDDDKNDEKLE